LLPHRAVASLLLCLRAEELMPIPQDDEAIPEEGEQGLPEDDLADEEQTEEHSYNQGDFDTADTGREMNNDDARLAHG
jgi:hypothetical protein